MLNSTSSLRLVLSLAALSVSSLAFAAPKVGDSASMNGTVVGPGMSMNVSTTQKITAFNANTGVYTVQQTQTVGSQTQVKENQVDADNMISEETAAMIVSSCESEGLGSKETVVVAAGTFTTCKISNDGALIWIAPVPFGYVKLQSPVQGAQLELGMTSFSRGQ